MSLNWSAFLTDEGLQQPNERWSAEPQPPQPQHQSRTGTANLVPASSSLHQSRHSPSRNTVHAPSNHSSASSSNNPSLSPYDHSQQQLANAYLSTDNYYDPNNYFLSDFDILQPFGNAIAGDSSSTADSSPEPSGTQNAYAVASTIPSTVAQTPATTLSSFSPASINQAIHRKQTLTDANYSTIYPSDITDMNGALIEDLTFSSGPRGPSTTTTVSSEQESNSNSSDRTLRNNASSQNRTDDENNSNAPTKRTKNGKADVLTACWTSPLCPNHSTYAKDGSRTPPNPSTCGGGCAPFLFANDGDLPGGPLDLGRDIAVELANAQIDAQTEPGTVAIRPRLKRSESSESGKATGRSLPSIEESPESDQVRMKTESSTSPPQDNNANGAAGEEKGKTRRRLPHNQVERKYRESLNTQLESLRRVVPALQSNGNGQAMRDGADIEDLPAAPASKPSKAVVLASATAYIKQMEREKRAMADENALLRARIKQLQALVKCEDCSLMQYVGGLKIAGGSTG